ncbi:SHOCT domain-containing protein [Petropleomorpha daqingensis]|uniref:Type VI protein secretion system component VasK n=1 Tax=Petropleomorpha daqingensis TaxID=2026353 RepID=A0A853CMR8_9ACTN|nr:SHOCT domain-containing protein [Petropleomorpha daqingensis]NYJ07538.1 type VI protein secretion system component VasK [Petropleomorpha daqingensis]
MFSAADNYPLVDLFWTFVWFFALVIYFWLIITVFADLFRRHDVSGWAKAGWVVFVLVLPLIGTLTYLVTQGRAMADRDTRQAREVKQQTDEYIRSVVSPGYRGVDEIARGKQLLDEGAISQEEFEQLKRRVLV